MPSPTMSGGEGLKLTAEIGHKSSIYTPRSPLTGTNPADLMLASGAA